MKKKLTFILSVLFSLSAFSQATPLKSFECNIKPGYQEFTQTQIETYISKVDFEKYRLQDKRTTLSFDNGFEITMLSANEAAASGLISDPTSYPKRFTVNYGLPTFHLTPDGLIGIRPPSITPASKKYILN